MHIYIYIYIYIYKGHSINTLNFALSTVAPFSRKSIIRSPFMFQKTVRMTSFTDSCTRNIFFTGMFVRFHSFCLRARSSKSTFILFVNFFFSETFFSVYITHSSVNFTCFVLLSN